MAFSAEDIVPDSPTNNFCTLNPLDNNNVTLLQGTLQHNDDGSDGWNGVRSTFGVSSGKWYWEVLPTPVGSVSCVSVCTNELPLNTLPGQNHNTGVTYYPNATLYKETNGVGVSYGATYSTGDIIGVLLDMDAGSVTFYKNNSSQGSASSNLLSYGDTWFPCGATYYSGSSQLFNFGQDPTFGGTKPVGNYAFNTAKIYSVLGGSERSANYTVEYSDDNSNWTTAWTGVMSNNTATGIQQGTGGGGSYGTHKYWRYVEGSAVVGHHPRISRIILSDGTNDTNLIVYNYDNSSDVGEYQPGTVAREISEGYTDTKGIGQFFYDPPSGALALCTANLPDFTPTVIDDVPQDYFKAVTYSGSIGNDQLVDCGFPADFIWIKGRTAPFNTEHLLYDTLRGRTSKLATNNSGNEYDYSTHPNGDLAPTLSTASNSLNGFKTSPVTNNNMNNSGCTYVAWFWRAGGPPDLTTPKPFAKNGVQYETLSAANITAGTITPTAMSVNTDAGFSIVKITTSNVEANDMSESFPHGLSKTPEFILGKELSGSDPWGVYHKNSNDGSAPTNLQALVLNSDIGTFTNSSYKTYEVTSSLIKIGRQIIEHNSQDGIFYCWHSVEGYSKFGSYTGNGDPDGPFVYCGFRPAFVMIKNIDVSSAWSIFDSARDESNVVGRWLAANLSNEEQDLRSSHYPLDFLSNGFKLRTDLLTGTTNINLSNIYIFMAFAEQPFKFSNAR